MAEGSVWEQKINVRFMSKNPIVRLIMFFVAILQFLIGVRKTGKLTEYEERVEITTTSYFIWFIRGGESTLVVKKDKITGYSVGFSRQWLFFKVVVAQLFASGLPEGDEMVLKGISFDHLKEKLQAMNA